MRTKEGKTIESASSIKLDCQNDVLHLFLLFYLLVPKFASFHTPCMSPILCIPQPLSTLQTCLLDVLDPSAKMTSSLAALCSRASGLGGMALLSAQVMGRPLVVDTHTQKELTSQTTILFPTHKGRPCPVRLLWKNNISNTKQ